MAVTELMSGKANQLSLDWNELPLGLFVKRDPGWEKGMSIKSLCLLG